MISYLAQLLAILLFLSALPTIAAELTVGYLEVSDDQRYAERTAYARIQLRANRRPLPGAEVAIQELTMLGRVIDADFALEHYRGADLDALLVKLEHWRQRDIRLVLLDLPAEMVAALAAKTRGEEMLLLNVSAEDDRLRGAQCAAHLMHLIPSYAMRTDGLVQYLVSKDWRNLLVLQGRLPGDADFVQALKRSARRFGAEIVAVRPFELGNDPRRRERNNIALLTAGETYDAVVVADVEGEFGRYVPYQTKAPRPVVGTTGLTPIAWTWVFERYGAPQVNTRFQRHAGRHMTGRDWAAWVGIKAIVQSVLRTDSTNFSDVARFLKSEQLRLDGAKGAALSFRTWNNQLRQPILLATQNAVIVKAPIKGFLHPRDELDSLGDDADESPCRLETAKNAKGGSNE